MSGPSQLRVKRKRNEQPVDALYVAARAAKDSNKKARTEQSEEPVLYVRQRQGEAARAAARGFESQSLRGNGEQQAKKASGPAGKDRRRTFHLSRAMAPARIEKSKDRRDLLTFEEKRQASVSVMAAATAVDAVGTDGARKGSLRSEAEPFKRPGKGAAVEAKAESKAASNHAERDGQAHLESLADGLHQFALEELARTPKPKLTALPKFPGSQSRAIHRQRTGVREPYIRDEEMEDASSGDYVFDTYVLTPAGSAGGAGIDANGNVTDIGYLIITDDDQSIWETYMEDEPSDREWDTDEEDENAEDYYGADYPEDELASDDEFDRDAYGYRRNGGSDNEEWDEDTGLYSDDEYEKTMNPWKAGTPAQFAKLKGQGDNKSD